MKNILPLFFEFTICFLATSWLFVLCFLLIILAFLLYPLKSVRLFIRDQLIKMCDAIEILLASNYNDESGE